MPSRTTALLAAFFVIPLACSTSDSEGDSVVAGDDDDDGGTTGDGTTGDDDGTTGDDGTTAGSDTGPMAEPPPTDASELLTWLEAGKYLEWPTESAVHESDGPHFGAVRTYVNDALLDSLQAGNPTHPMGAASVKELYGAGAMPQGWSVNVKVADGMGGDTWYFFEHYNSTTYGDGVGDASCTGCHGSGAIDYFKSPFPLQ